MEEPQRLELALLPTPLIRLRRLEQELGGGQIWLKRDDLTGLELSGNKVRKLEYIAADALAHGQDTLVTEGTPQSNHCRATAAVCAKLGFHAVLLLRPQPPATVQGNHLLDTLFGAQTRCYPREDFERDHEHIVDEVMAELQDSGRKPRWIPMGASEPLGCWGYIRAIAELSLQLQEYGIQSCDVLMPVSSGGTYAGALLGARLHSLESIQLWGVPVSDDVPYHTRSIGDLCRRTISEFSLPFEFAESSLRFLGGFVGDGYALPYPAALDAISLLARTEGVVLDPVYTAKALCALLHGLRNDRFGRDRPIVFIHTGGIFSDFAHPAVI